MKDQNMKPSPINYYECGLKDGDELVCIDDPTVVATVAGEHKVLYKGELTSLTAIARSLKRHAVAGPACFTYKGELLSSIVKRMQSEK